MSVQILCPFFNQVFLFWYWVVWTAYIFCILTPCQLHHLQIVSPIQCAVFLFCRWCVLLSKSFKFNWVLFVYFTFIYFTLEDRSKKIWAKFMSKNVLPMFSSRDFMISGLTFRSLIHFEFILYMIWGNVLISLFYR